MKTPPLIAALALVAWSQSACDSDKGKELQSKAAPQKSTGSPAAPSDDPKHAETSSGVVSSPQRARYTWAALQTGDIKDGISPPAAAPSEQSEPSSGGEGRALTFSRLAAGENTFCGVLRAGPIRCSGRLSSFEKGAFVDVAVAGKAVCGVTAAGAVQCTGLTEQPQVSGAKRIAAGGDDICVADGSGVVSCFSANGTTPLSPPPELKAKYFVVGGGFACAADEAARLRCWGKTSGLGLPAEPPLVRDLAAGKDFVCYLTEHKELSCLGSAPKVPKGTFAAIAAGFGQLCAVSDTNQAQCFGDHEVSLDGVARISVGSSSVCAINDQGIVRCAGQGSFSELAAPIPANEPDPVAQQAKPLSNGAFATFVKLFPQVKLPYALDRSAVFDFGDRLPAQFSWLVGGDANVYRTGVRIPTETGAVAVTLLHLPTGMIQLHTFSADGKPAKLRTLAGRDAESGPTEDAADGTGMRTISVQAVESVVTAEGLVETTSYEGEEVTHYVKKHLDGSRPISRISCKISGTKARDALRADGQFVRKSAQVLPARSTTDNKGCQGAWPMGG